MRKQQSTSIYFLLLLVPFFWGGAFVATEHIITEVPPITASSLRFGSAGIILLFYVLIREKVNVQQIKKQWRGLLFMALTGTFAYNVFFSVGLEMTSAINGSLIMATTPVFMTLGAVFFLGEVWNKQLGLGLILSLIGVFVVISQGSLAVLLHFEFNRGDILFIGALACWVAHGLLGKVVMKDVSPVVTTITMLVGSVILFFTSLSEQGWGDVRYMSGQAWLEMAFIVIASSAIAYFLWNHGIEKIGASKVSVYMNLVPINTAVIAVLLYGSSITLTQIFGMIMVIVGVYFVTLHPVIMNRRLKYKENGIY